MTNFDINNSADWTRITGAELPIELPEARWSEANWRIGLENAAALYELVRWTRPRVIIETGTFEGHGTTTMAAAAHANANGATIFTVDYNGDPSVDTISDSRWAELEAIRHANLAAARQQYPNCEIRFVEGDTREVLPEVITEIDEWDLFFQDSMHFVEGIRAEWDILKSRGSSRSIVIFDDISAEHPFTEFFAEHEAADWNFRTHWRYRGGSRSRLTRLFRRSSEHPQLWAQRKT